jgi:hypothetical protein
MAVVAVAVEENKLKKFRFNYTVFKEYGCSRYANGESEELAKNKLVENLLKEDWEKPIKKKDIVFDSVEEIITKKGKKR